MKANYNRKVKAREKSVAFRTEKSVFCIAQSTIYDRLSDDRDVVYLDFENEQQIDKLINTLEALKNSIHQNVDKEQQEVLENGENN